MTATRRSCSAGRATYSAHRPPRRVRWHRVALSGAETRVLAALARVRTRRARDARGQNEQALLLLSVFRKRALSTMWALSQSHRAPPGVAGRFGPEAALDWAQPRLVFGEDERPGRTGRARGLTVHSGTGPASRSGRGCGDCGAGRRGALREERKIGRLIALIRRTREPVVVFTEFRDSLDAMRRRLPFAGRCPCFMAARTRSMRRAAAASCFSDGTTSVLLATDVAGQGLNLQSRARWVISLELPWNPARLEQRIGRVDRISQNATDAPHAAGGAGRGRVGTAGASLAPNPDSASIGRRRRAGQCHAAGRHRAARAAVSRRNRIRLAGVDRWTPARAGGGWPGAPRNHSRAGAGWRRRGERPRRRGAPDSVVIRAWRISCRADSSRCSCSRSPSSTRPMS